MATIRQPLTGATTHTFPRSSVSFDWMVVLLEAWWVGGLFVDGWAHAHGKVDQSFFTPWHAILYSGFFANALFFASVMFSNHTKGYPWSRSVPRGYEFAVLGVGIFLGCHPECCVKIQVLHLERIICREKALILGTRCQD